MSSEELLNENLQEQQDEVLALQSIYNTDDDEKLKVISDGSQDNQGTITIVVSVSVKPVSEKIQISVALPNEDGEELQGAAAFPEAPNEPPALSKDVKMNRSISGRKWEGSFEVKYLSPVYMYITFPRSYPSHDAPEFYINCGWLTPLQIQSLSPVLYELWEASSAMPVVFTWVDWLENNILEHLGITDFLTLRAWEQSQTMDTEMDLDVMIPIEDEIGDLVASLIQYNRELVDIEFCQNQHECEVCCDEKSGLQFFKLRECGHKFCHECMTAFCELHVRDGTVEELRCPDTECDSLLPPYIVQAVLDPVAYERWEKLLLQKTLDAMGDSVYCPRCQSLVISEAEEDLHLGLCTVCFFSFCTQCSMCWHQGSSCETDENKIEKALKKRSTMSLEEQRKYDELVQKLQDDLASKKKIQKNTRNCPKCKIPVEKIGGCNKMTCKCGQSFCWLCGISIAGYCHFRSANCVLFPGQMQALDEAAVRRAMPPDAVIRMRARLAVNPELAGNQIRCPMCKQLNLKTSNNNHVKCWNCKGNFCFMCSSRIDGGVTRHFNRGLCVQHS